MLSAFHAQPIHELKQRDKSRIESLLAYGDRLLVGLNNGALRIYRVNEASQQDTPEGRSDAENGDPPVSPTKSKAKAVELLREEEKFSRRPVQQLAIVKEVNLLVSLSDGYISLHDLQTYQLVEKLDMTKGAACFTVTSNVVKDSETGVPSLVSRLAVGVKRKMLCWTWQDMEQLPDVQEISLEASVKSLTWATGTRTIVGMDAGFSIVDVESEAITPINKPASRGTEGSATELAGVRFGAVSSSGMGYMGMGSWVPKPMVTGLSNGQVLLAKDVNTLFADSDGNAIEKRQIPWALAPEAIGYSYPYLLGLQPPEKGSLQIRNPDTLSLLQTIAVPNAAILHVPQPNISLAHAGKGFLVASDRVIWRMNALPYEKQLEDLVGKGRFDEAISLLNLLEDTLIEGKADRIREIMIQKATALFQDRKYRPALDLFSDAEAPPERVIKLYPPVIAGILSDHGHESEEIAAEEGNAESKLQPDPAKEAPSTPSKSLLGRMTGSHRKKDSVETASIKTPAPQDAEAGTPQKAPASKSSLDGEDLKFATRSLCSFLVQARTRMQRYINFDGSLKEDPPTFDSETGRPAFANLLPQHVLEQETIEWREELLNTARLLDTTLFRAYMLASPSLAGPLFRLDNFCDPEVVQSALYETERYNDLIDFLHGKKLHRQALEMLAKFGKGEAEGEVPEGLSGPERTVGYLKQLPPELTDIVLEFVRWPISVAPDEGMSVFLADTDNAEKLPKDRVVDYLADIDRMLEARYLEHIITELNEQDPDLHQRLVDIYLEQLKHPGDDTPETTSAATKSRLEAFLTKSKHYNKAKTFRQLPSDNPTFYESRALVLSAMGNHKQALAIYVFQLNDYAKAEEYCNRTFLDAEQNCLVSSTGGAGAALHEKQHHEEKGTNNIFAVLLGLYLRPPEKGEEKRWPQALDLLSRHGARLPASSTLDLMPDDLAVSQLSSYFQGRMRLTTSQLYSSRITKALESVRQVNAERHLLLGRDKEVEKGVLGGRNRRVRIGEDDHCWVCLRRFGASAVRVYPGGEVVHYGCVQRREAAQQAQAGGGGGGGQGGRRGWG